MKTKLSTFFFTLLICPLILSQPQSQNMRFYSNLNAHSNGQYSAIWGYVAPDGREYAILGCPTGTAFVDITDTTNIHEVDFLPGLSSSWREMKTYGTKAYIVSEASSSGLQIVDLSYLPDSVSLKSVFTFSGYTRTHTISQSGPYLYLNGGDYILGGTFILDLTSRTGVPVKRGEWETEYIHDCRVVNDTIWGAGIFDGNIYVIDARDKNNLTTITSFQNIPDPGPHNTALSQDHKFLFVTDEIGGNPRYLKVWNVENVFNPVQVATWQPTGITTSIVHNIETYGSYAVVAHYTAGVRVLDITNPASLMEIAWYDTYPADNGFTYNGCWGVYMFPSSKIIASDRQTGLYVMKTTNPLVSTQNNDPIPKKYSLKQNYPNPFNPSTKIEYSVPENAYITIKIFDVLGKEVARIADGYERAGQHLVTYDASHLPSGVYFYKLETKGFSETRRMVLVK
ncbi:MAG TPA: choice-of-anchor B family protein [Ignavibacteria bacterium]|jgi:choice-of-anchor B domain-containing protein